MSTKSTNFNGIDFPEAIEKEIKSILAPVAPVPPAEPAAPVPPVVPVAPVPPQAPSVSPKELLRKCIANTASRLTSPDFPFMLQKRIRPDYSISPDIQAGLMIPGSHSGQPYYSRISRITSVEKLIELVLRLDDLAHIEQVEGKPHLLCLRFKAPSDFVGTVPYVPLSFLPPAIRDSKPEIIKDENLFDLLKDFGKTPKLYKDEKTGRLFSWWLLPPFSNAGFHRKNALGAKKIFRAENHFVSFIIDASRNELIRWFPGKQPTGQSVQLGIPSLYRKALNAYKQSMAVPEEHGQQQDSEEQTACA